MRRDQFEGRVADVKRRVFQPELFRAIADLLHLLIVQI